jgi:hypothetical protein
VSPSMETRPVPNATASASILEGYVRSRDLMFQMLRARIFASLRLRGWKFRVVDTREWSLR